MTAERQELKILIDLDAIIDTRLGTIDAIDPEKAVKVLKDDRYFFRTKDDFEEICDISSNQFKDAYAKRNVDILKRSMICPTVTSLKEITVGLEIQRVELPIAPKPIVELNVWPYELDDVTLSAIKAAMLKHTGGQTYIRAVFLKPEEITIRKLRNENYGAFFTYSFRDWLVGRLQELDEVQVPRMSLFAPMIFEQDISQIDTKEFMKEGMDPLRGIEMLFAMCFALDIMPTFMFSIYRPDKHYDWINQAYRKIVPLESQNPLIQKNEELQEIYKAEGRIPLPDPPSI